jgi:acetyl/propionyl-CoA carboxylase alpha subunit
MRSESTQKVQFSNQKVLILGERSIARWIAKQLSDEGYQPIFQNEIMLGRLPLVRDPHGFDQIRSALMDFATISEGRGIVHPGVSPWAERPELSSIAQEFGLTVIGPSRRILTLMGNKLNFLFEAEKLGIPHLVQSFDPIQTMREIDDFNRKNGQVYPFVLKSVHGGGNAGIFVIHDPNSWVKGGPLWFDQLRRQVGEVIFFIERYLEGARHIVVPFARFQTGATEVFPTLDTSLQCRYRKLVEICPARRIDPEVQKKVNQWTIDLANHCGYIGVGAMEFLVDGSRAFLVNGIPRLTSSFHLWDRLAGTQAVSWQLAAMSSSNPKPPIRNLQRNVWTSGMSVKLYAEDSRFLLPQPGRVHEVSKKVTWDLSDSCAEVHLNYEENEDILISSSGRVGHILAFAKDRSQLVKAVRGVLNELWIAGSIQTNEQFLQELLAHPWVREEIFHAGFIDEEFLPHTLPPQEVLSWFAAICHSHPKLQRGEGKRFRWWINHTGILQTDIGQIILPWTQAPHYWSDGERLGVSGELSFADGNSGRVCAYPVGDRWVVRMGGWTALVRRVSVDEGTQKLHQKPKLSALVPGRVHAIFFREKTDVRAHEPLLVIESLGAFIPHSISYSVRVIRWKVSAEDIVTLGQELAEIELAPMS